MLNPSTADAAVNDPTIRRCIGFSRLWGYGQLYVVNLWSLRSTNPAALYAQPHPNDLQFRTDAGLQYRVNMGTIERLAMACTFRVAAWGVHGALHGQGDAVARAITVQGLSLHHLGRTKDGHTKHPLYLSRWVLPQSWEAR